MTETSTLRTDPSRVLTSDLTLAYGASVLICVAVAVVALSALAWNGLYGDVPSALVSPGGDVAAVVVVLPSLIASTAFARRGSLLALLWWPGTLFYALYTYALYLLAAPFTVLTFLYVLLVVLCAATLTVVIASIDADVVRSAFANAPARVTGGVLIVVGLAAYAGLIGAALPSLGSSTFALRSQWSVDMALGTPVLVLGGIGLWLRLPLGYVVAGPLLLVSALGGLAFVVAALFDNAFSAPGTEPAVIVVHLVISAVSAIVLGFFSARALTPRVRTTPA